VEDKSSLGLKKKTTHPSLLIFLSTALGDKSNLFSRSHPQSELCITSDKEFVGGGEREGAGEKQRKSLKWHPDCRSHKHTWLCTALQGLEQTSL